FLRLANEYGNEEIAAIICNLNDRLHHARVAESFALDGLQEELQTLGRLIDEDERSALVEMVRKYHERRISALEAIHRELLLLPSASPDRSSAEDRGTTARDPRGRRSAWRARGSATHAASGRIPRAFAGPDPVASGIASRPPAAPPAGLPCAACLPCTFPSA